MESGALFALLANMLQASSSQQDQARITELRVRIDELRGARATLAEQLERQFPDYAQLVNPKPPDISTAKAALLPGEALLVTYVGADESYVWAIPSEGEDAFSVVPIGKKEIEVRIGQLRHALDPNAQTLGDIPEFDLDLAYQLYADLFLPVEKGWRDAQSLLVVADGALSQLPLSVLPTEPTELDTDREILFESYKTVPWLARRVAVSYLPSVASLTTLRGLPNGAENRRAFVGFGDPLFSPQQAAAAAAAELPGETALASRGILATRGLPVQLRSLADLRNFESADLAMLPRLPDTAEEVRSIALALNADMTRDVFLGKAANEQTIKSMSLSGYRVLVFATHGLVPGDLNGLTQPALAFSDPNVAGVEGDGLLTMGEILGLELDADWVVLSACNTAAAQGAGAEAISGLGRAFFYAGARSLLVSNWPVETTSAKALTTDIFRKQADDPSLSRAQALRGAMLGVMDGPGYLDGEGRTVFSYAHPIFWAPFTLIGDGSGGKPTS
jgi:CHAT domain-containing protein